MMILRLECVSFSTRSDLLQAAASDPNAWNDLSALWPLTIAMNVWL
jgi:hypothetical protein